MAGNLFTVRAPAKINLSLHVVGIREDGYHELRTVFQSIALYDTLTIRVRRGPFALVCDDPACPADATNLVWRAAERAWTAAGRRGTMRGVEIHLAKRIPIQAGLGGGSSDAAAALRALGSVWRADDRALREMAASIGADVPYFLEGGTVLGLDRGDRLYPLVGHGAAWVALVLPGFGVSTADAFRWWDEENSGRSILTNKVRPASLEDVGRTLSGPASDPGNDLQDVVAARHPEIVRIVGALRRAGASHAAMSGSGSAVFGLFASRRAADVAARALSKGAGGTAGSAGRRPRRVFVTRIVNRAAYQRLAAIRAHRINLPFASRRPGHS
jgi:4-diphosphocytidyl-2-C-methyl-D-erythritol kinase